MPGRHPAASTLLLPGVFLIGATLIYSPQSMGQTTIYRCIDAAGTPVFSDQPCGEQAQPHQTGARLSIIEAPDDVEAVVEANRVFIDQQRERRQAAAQQRARLDELPAVREPPSAPQPRVQFVPYWLPPAHHKPRPSPDPVERQREERFSALSGRQPGSVRRSNQ